MFCFITYVRRKMAALRYVWHCGSIANRETLQASLCLAFSAEVVISMCGPTVVYREQAGENNRQNTNLQSVAPTFPGVKPVTTWGVERPSTITAVPCTTCRGLTCSGDPLGGVSVTR